MFTILFLLLFLFLAFLYIYHETTAVVVERVKISTGFNLESPLQILHLSDLHFRRWGRVESRVLSLIKREHPPLILLSGDYLSNRENMKEWMRFLKELAESSLVYAVRGNHDYYDSNLKSLFRKLGIALLSNQGVSLQLGGISLNIIGVETPDLGYARLEKAVSSLNLKGSFNIVLSHTYHIIESGEGMGIHLYLVGDTHGGQIDIPYLSQKLLQHRHEVKYMKGKYSLRGSTLYVNRGLGWVFLPIRFRSRPEIALLELS